MSAVLDTASAAHPNSINAVSKVPRRLLKASDDVEGEGYSSSPGSTNSALLLKPLTPAQSGEHRLHEAATECAAGEPKLDVAAIKEPMILPDSAAVVITVEEHANGSVSLPLRWVALLLRASRAQSLCLLDWPF
jgi:hypothetical protein